MPMYWWWGNLAVWSVFQTSGNSLLVVTSSQPVPLPLLRPLVIILSLNAAEKTTLCMGSVIGATNTSVRNLSCRLLRDSEGRCGLFALF